MKFLASVALLTALWVVCPYLCSTTEASEGVHACCVEGAGVQEATECCSLEKGLYLPSSASSGGEASQPSLVLHRIPLTDPGKVLGKTPSHLGLLGPPETPLNQRVSLVL
jgi:hypothetical protein